MRPAAPLLALLALLGACGAADTPPRVSGAWLRALPAGADTTAAYMTIENDALAHRTITQITSPAFTRAELHETRIEDGMARMAEVPRLDIAPGARVALAPGGLHLMLSGPTQALAPGARVPLRLLLADGSVVDVEAEVRAP